MSKKYDEPAIGVTPTEEIRDVVMAGGAKLQSHCVVILTLASSGIYACLTHLVNVGKKHPEE